MITSKDFPFLTAHGEFLHPQLIAHRVPSSMDVTYFMKNASAPADEELPYVLYGGKVLFERFVEFCIFPREAHLLIYVSSGRMTFGNHTHKDTFGPGNFILAYPGESYTLKTITKNAAVYFFFCCGNLLTTYNRVLYPSRTPGCYSCCSFASRSHAIMHHVDRLTYYLSDTSLQASYMESCLIQDLLVLLFAEIAEPCAYSDDLPHHILQIKTILDIRYAENISLDFLEEELGMNKYRICREFRRYLQISPMKYLNRVRIQHAKQLLSNTNETVVSIGTQVGIPGTTHFINLFKKETGDTPLSYRRLHANAMLF